jgi:hypothetical protein
MIKFKQYLQILSEQQLYDPTADPRLVSTRIPTSAKTKTDPHTLHGAERLVVDIASMSPEHIERVGEFLKKPLEGKTKSGKSVSGSHSLLGPTDNLSNRDAFRLMTDRSTEIVDWHLQRAEGLPEMASRSRQWYEGANKITRHFGDKYGHSHEKVAGVMAVLSPQMDWYKNASLGERVMHIHGEHTNTTWTPEMEEKTGKIFKKGNTEHQEMLAAIRGKKLGEIEDPKHAAAWIRTYDEAHHPRHYRAITPEGEFGEHVQVGGGKKRGSVTWGGFGDIAKAVTILRSKPGDIETISKSLGGAHKVRSFYNNILQPKNPDRPDSTIDTHAIGVGSGQITHSGTHPVVAAGLGGNVGDAITGVKGTYPIYRQAYTNVGQMRGYRPSEVQSVTWDDSRATKGEFTKGGGQAEEIARLHDSLRSGDIGMKELKQGLASAYGQQVAPSWMYLKTKSLKSRGSTFMESLKKKIEKLLNESKQTLNPRRSDYPEGQSATEKEKKI